MAERRDSVPQLDVLDLRTRVVPLVVHSRLMKNVAPYCSAPRPERLGLPRVLVVHVMMEKVAIFAHHSLRRRTVVVGAEDRADVRLGGEYLGEEPQGVGVHEYISIDEDDILPAADLEPPVSRVCRPVRPARQAHYGIGITRCNDRCLVVRGIIDDDQLPAFAGQVAGCKRGERPAQHGAAVMRWDHYRQIRVFRTHGYSAAVASAARTRRAPDRTHRYCRKRGVPYASNHIPARK